MRRPAASTGAGDAAVRAGLGIGPGRLQAAPPADSPIRASRSSRKPRYVELTVAPMALHPCNSVQ